MTLESFYINEKTKFHYQNMSNMLARLEFMEDGDDKNALRAEAEAIKDLVDVCIVDDLALKTEIDAVVDDVDALEQIHIRMERLLNEVMNSGTYA